MKRRTFLGASGLLMAHRWADSAPRMPSWRRGMPRNQFSPIPGSSPSKFNLEPAWNKTGSKYVWTGEIIKDWCGLQTDEKRGVVYSALAGGHAGTEQNGVYGVDLMGDKPGWEVVRASTAHSPKDPANQNIAHFSDGRPTSRHTYYDGVVVEIDSKPVIVFVESTASTFVGQGPPNVVDAFHLDRKDWDLNGVSWPRFPGRARYANCVAKDPRDQSIWVADNGDQIFRLNPGKRQWDLVVRSFNRWGAGFMGSIIDARRDRLIIGGSLSVTPRNAPAFGVWNIATAKYEDKVLTGAGAQYFENGDYSALTHDTANDRYLYMASVTGRVLAVDPVTFAATAVTTAPKAVNGVHNRFAFVPLLGGCFYLPTWESDVLFLPVV